MKKTVPGSMSIAAALAMLLATAACGGGGQVEMIEMPRAPEEVVAEAYNLTAENANVILATDTLGYLGPGDGLVRLPADCLDDICIAGQAVIYSASRRGVDAADIELLGERGGVQVIVQRTGAEDIDYRTISGWLEHSFFATRTNLWSNPELPVWGTKSLYAYAVGSSTGENPGLADGSARWEGAMFGQDTTASSFARVVEGDAAVTVEFGAANPKADVAFTNIVEHETGAPRNDMTWRGLALKEGGFSMSAAPDDTIAGRFFGPNQEEVGGIFERDGIAGAFGAVRAPE